ncbi:unnamed protein product [Calicophoron daubneyi]|uniref:GP-PDE domain-containing protein n=1 Tax=Calicophoron daubneyi TaxID=300641 RepID=A0AAV2TX44_CALDB
MGIWFVPRPSPRAFSVLAAAVTGYAVTSYVLFKKPHLLHKRKSFPFIAHHISHRGGAGERIENSKEAFENACALGTELLEIDCRLTKDNEVVVFHDEDLKRCTGVEGAVRDFNYVDLPRYLQRLEVAFEPGTFCDRTNVEPSKILRLRDVFEAFPNVPINIDIKDNDDRLVHAVADLIREYKREKLTVWGGMSCEIADKCRRILPDALIFPPGEYVIRILVYCYLGLLPFMPIPYSCFELPMFFKVRSRAFLRQRGSDTLSTRVFFALMDFFMTSPALFRHLHARGIPVFLWVGNTPEDFQKAFDLGADGVMTDYPTRLRAFLSSHPSLPGPHW